MTPELRAAIDERIKLFAEAMAAKAKSKGYDGTVCEAGIRALDRRAREDEAREAAATWRKYRETGVPSLALFDAGDALAAVVERRGTDAAK